MLNNMRIQEKIAKVLFTLYKLFSIEYKILNGLKNKKEQKVINYLMFNRRFVLYKDKQNWNILDNAHLFQCHKVIDYLTKKYSIDYSREYKVFVIDIIFNKLIKDKYTTNGLNVIKTSFKKIHKIKSIQMENIEKTINLFIIKNGY